MKRRPARLATAQVMGAAVLLLAALACGGCNVIAWVATVVPQEVKAVYKLENRPTLVMVEDPKHVFDDPTMPTRISHEITDALADAKVVTQLIDPDEVASLSVSLGGDFHRAGIDQIGQAVGAEQVVHVHVDWAVVYTQPGLSRPGARVEVKVIDVVARRRLFPSSAAAEGDGGAGLGGYGVKIQMGARGSGARSASTDRAQWSKLASRIARDTAYVFYNHYPRQPGEPFE